MPDIPVGLFKEVYGDTSVTVWTQIDLLVIYYV